MYGFYPADNAASIASPQGIRPHRPTYKPTYSFVSTPSSAYPTANPQWDHETNHISINSPSSSQYYPNGNVANQRPDNHFGLVDESGYGVEADAIYSSNNQYGTNHGYNQDDDDYYRPVPGTVFIHFVFSSSEIYKYSFIISH